MHRNFVNGPLLSNVLDKRNGMALECMKIDIECAKIQLREDDLADQLMQASDPMVQSHAANSDAPSSSVQSVSVKGALGTSTSSSTTTTTKYICTWACAPQLRSGSVRLPRPQTKEPSEPKRFERSHLRSYKTSSQTSSAFGIQSFRAPRIPAFQPRGQRWVQVSSVRRSQ